MDRAKSNPRLFSIITTQTDTTVGFLSLSQDRLCDVKSRDRAKRFIKVYKDFSSMPHRVPTKFKNSVRRAKKTTFIIKQESFRVAPKQKNSQLLRDATWLYSTSANQSGEGFEMGFVKNRSDIIIEDIAGLKENKSSTIIRLNNHKKQKVR